MTVKELITKLLEYDIDKEVCICQINGCPLEVVVVEERQRDDEFDEDYLPDEWVEIVGE